LPIYRKRVTNEHLRIQLASITSTCAGIDEPLAQSRSELSFYNADGLGSITSLTDSSGAPTATFVYGAFGVLNSSTGSAANSYRYTAREYDPETGLHYYRARYYEIENGRFLSEDPIRYEAGLNFFAYVNNRPTTLMDPNGLDAFTSGDFWAAWEHYCDGSGAPWTVSFSSVNWGDTQNNLSIKIKGMLGAGCAARTIPINLTHFEAHTSGNDAGIIGRHSVNVSGTVQVNCDCSWTFNGNMSSSLGFDTYDFNSSNRGIVGESKVFVGRNRCPLKGKPFNIKLPGSLGLVLSGKLDGASTCACKNKKP
jgi:RHS repeat-associated protein